MRWTHLKQLRLSRSLLQIEVAQRTGINPARLSYIENEHVTPRPDELERIALALGCPVETLQPVAQQPAAR